MDFNKTLNINKRFVLIMLLVVGIVLISSYSYALFQVNFIKSNVVILKSASNLNITTTIDSTNSDTFTLNGNESKQITVHLTTDGITSAMAYKMYYELTGNGKFTVTSTETFTDDKVEGIMQPITKTGYDYKVTGKDIVLTFTNNSTNSLTITLGAIGGFEKTGASLTDQSELILNISLSKPLTSEDIKTRLVSNNTSSTCQNATLTYTEDGITYISGSATCIDFNYLWYSGKMWRITAIYPDGAMKLVTDNNITTIAFDETSTGGVNFYIDANTKSYMYQWLNEDFYDTLYNASSFIDTSKQWNATMPENTTISTKPGNTNLVTANVGLLNSYEYYNSYRCNGSSACTGSSYSAGYLNIGYYWWLLNPYNASFVWYVSSNGSGGCRNGPTSTSAARPSINLLSTVKILGTGTKTDPYRVVGDKEVGITGNDLNTRQVGEYVKLKSGDNEQVFRIVSFENNTTKLIALDYVDGGNTTKTFATANSSGNGTIFGEGNTVDDTNTTTWYSYLTNTYISDLKTKYDTNPSNSMFTSGNYYLGINADNASDTTTYYNYRTSICASTSNLTKNCTKSRSKTLEAGLLRYGEMFATQQSWGSQTNKNMWLMTRRTESRVWRVGSNGNGSDSGPTYASAARPSINLASSVKIVACDTELCDGTPDHPYVVGL